jgi:molybdopterin-guanine dinucleotide biosynthesis protein A
MTSSAAILARGGTMRFSGHDKNAIIVGRRTTPARQYAQLSAITGDILPGGQTIPPPGFPGSRVAGDRFPWAGPAPADRLISLACDMAVPVPGWLTDMAGPADDADLIVPLTERGYHPLCAVYTRACAPAVTRRLD